MVGPSGHCLVVGQDVHSPVMQLLGVSMCGMLTMSSFATQLSSLTLLKTAQLHITVLSSMLYRAGDRAFRYHYCKKGSAQHWRGIHIVAHAHPSRDGLEEGQNLFRQAICRGQPGQKAGESFCVYRPCEATCCIRCCLLQTVIQLPWWHIIDHMVSWMQPLLQYSS